MNPVNEAWLTMARTMTVNDLARVYHEALRLVLCADNRDLDRSGPFGYVLTRWDDLGLDEHQQVYGVVETFLAGGQWHQCYYFVSEFGGVLRSPWFMDECRSVLANVITPLAEFVRTPDCVGPVS